MLFLIPNSYQPKMSLLLILYKYLTWKVPFLVYFLSILGPHAPVLKLEYQNPELRKIVLYTVSSFTGPIRLLPCFLCLGLK